MFTAVLLYCATLPALTENCRTTSSSLLFETEQACKENIATEGLAFLESNGVQLKDFKCIKWEEQT